MKQKIKKLLASTLIAALVFTLCPTQALDTFAAAAKTGYEILVEPTLVYESVYGFENGVSRVTNAAGKEGLIGIDGKEIIPCKYSWLNISGNFVVANNYDEQDRTIRGLYTLKGDLVLECKYSHIYVINDNCLVVSQGDGIWNICDAKGNSSTTFECEYMMELDANHICIYKDGEYGIISTTGETVVSCEYSDCDFYYSADKILLQDTNGIWFSMNYDGTEKVELGKYDYVEGYHGLEARTSVNCGLRMTVELDSNGNKISEPDFSAYEYDVQESILVEDKQIILCKAYKTVYVYDYDLNIINQFEDYYFDEISVSNAGLFLTKSYQGDGVQVVYDLEGNPIISTEDGIYTSLVLAKYGEAIIATVAADGSQVILNKQGEVLETYTADATISEVCEGCLAVQTENNIQLVDYKGTILKDMTGFTTVEALNLASEDERCDIDYKGLYFIAMDGNGATHLYNKDMEELTVADVTLDTDNIYIEQLDNDVCIFNVDYSSLILCLDTNGKLRFSFSDGSVMGTYEDEILCYSYNDDYDEYWLVSYDGTELISRDKGYCEIEPLDNDYWVAKDKGGKWYLLNQNYETVASLGKYERVYQQYYINGAYPGIIAYDYYEEETGADFVWYNIYTVYSYDGKVIIPKTNGRTICYDEASETWCISGGNSTSSVVYDKSGNKICDFGVLEETGYYIDGYLPYQASNGKWGVLKVSDGTHTTHTPKNTGATKATFSTNGASADTVCSVCGATIATGKTIYAASNVSASSKVYNGKNQKTTVVVKDSKGNTISASEYTVIGTTKAKKVGTYNITITFKSGSQKYSGSKTITWQIKPKQTKITKITAGKKKITLKWSKQTSQTKGYKIQYSTSKNFTKNVKTITIKKNKTTSTTIKKLKSKKKYYVRICTYKGGCTSAWSKTKSIKVK